VCISAKPDAQLIVKQCNGRILHAIYGQLQRRVGENDARYRLW
jgi:hypothetical protein